MAATLVSPLPVLRFCDNNGNALSGGKVFVYLAGTTTKATTYTDSTGNTPTSDPIILNTRGEAQIWLTPGTAYKFVLSPSTDSDPPTGSFWTVDNVTAPVSPNATIALSTAAINETSLTLASGATVAIGAAAANYIFISGTTAITAFDTVQSGTERTLEFQGALTLTQNATSLILPGGINITTAAGDTAIFRSEGSGNWRCISYQPATRGVKQPTITVLTSGSGTYTTPAGAARLEVRMVGGGGGGAGSGTTAGGGGNGGNTTFGALTAGLGSGGTQGAVGAGGTATGGDFSISGAAGGSPSATANQQGGAGGATPFGGQGNNTGAAGGGENAVANSGSGGSGASNAAAGNSGGGGGAGAYIEKMITSPAATFSYGVGAGGAGGTAGGSGFVGGNGGSGAIIVREFYS